MPKLSPEEVQTIRAERAKKPPTSYRELARRFGCSVSLVHDVAHADAPPAPDPAIASLAERLRQPDPRPLIPITDSAEQNARALAESELARTLEFVAAGGALSVLDTKRLVETAYKLRQLQRAPAPEQDGPDPIDFMTRAELDLFALFIRLKEILVHRAQTQKLPPAPAAPEGMQPIRSRLPPREDCPVFTLASELLEETTLGNPNVVHRPLSAVGKKVVRLASVILKRGQLGPDLPTDLEPQIDALLTQVGGR